MVKRLITFLVIFIALALLGYKIWDLALNRPPTIDKATARFQYAETFEHVRDTVYPNVLAHARQIAWFGSRQTGQPGCNLAVQYVEMQLRQMGYDVNRGAYQVTVPVEQACSVTLVGADPAT